MTPNLHVRACRCRDSQPVMMSVQVDPPELRRLPLVAPGTVPKSDSDPESSPTPSAPRPRSRLGPRVARPSRVGEPAQGAHGSAAISEWRVRLRCLSCSRTVRHQRDVWRRQARAVGCLRLTLAYYSYEFRIVSAPNRTTLLAFGTNTWRVPDSLVDGDARTYAGMAVATPALWFGGAHDGYPLERELLQLARSSEVILSKPPSVD